MKTTPSMVPAGQMLRRICFEYIEMPGLRLTCAQAQRLFGLNERACASLLDELVDRRFLARHSTGRYVRRADGRANVDALLRTRRQPPPGNTA